MDHKIIKSRRQKYPTSTSINELNAALIDDDGSIGDQSGNGNSNLPHNNGNEAGGGGTATLNGDDRTDSITTMRSDMNQVLPSYPSTSSPFDRTLTRNNSFYDYIITPYEYFLFCLGFSIATVPVVVAISFSATMLSHIRTSGLGNGGFFLGYALCSLSLSKSVVDTLGCKYAILSGFLGSSIFVLSFLIASVLYRSHIHLVYPIGATIGGVSQAIMWTAQGKYFTRVARMQVTSMAERDVEEMNRQLAEQFAIVYLRSLVVGFSICLIVLVIRLQYHWITRYVNLPILCCWLLVSLYLLWTLNDLGDKGGSFWTNLRLRRGFYALLRATRDLSPWSQWKMILLIPYQLAWGCCTSFWLFYILGEVVFKKNEKIAVGVATLVNLLVAAFFTQLTTAFTQISQSAFIMIGGISTVLMGLILALVDINNYSTFGLLILHSFFYGLSRSVYENNFMAVIADFFPDRESLAYSVAGFIKTLAAGITLIVFAFYFRDFTRWYFAMLILSTSIFGVIGYVLAVICHKRERAEQLTQRLHQQSISSSHAGGGVRVKTESLYGASDWAEDNDVAYSGSSGASTKYSYLRVASLTQDENNIMYVPEYF